MERKEGFTMILEGIMRASRGGYYFIFEDNRGKKLLELNPRITVFREICDEMKAVGGVKGINTCISISFADKVEQAVATKGVKRKGRPKGSKNKKSIAKIINENIIQA